MKVYFYDSWFQEQEWIHRGEFKTVAINGSDLPLLDTIAGCYSFLTIVRSATGSLILAAASSLWQRVMSLKTKSQSSKMRIEDRFKDMVQAYPELIAIRSLSQCLTYSKLDMLSEQAAQRLRDSGVRPGTFVGVAVTQGVEMIIAWLSVLKCGGTYCPIDLAQEADRLHAHLARIELPVVLASKELSHETVPQSARHIEWPSCEVIGSQLSIREIEDVPSLDSAILIFTSGSTDRPKGVVVTHESVCALTQPQAYLALGPGDCVPQVAYPAFDASTFEIWAPLLNGATVAVVDRSEILMPESFETFVREGAFTVCFLTSSWFHMLARARPQALALLKSCLVGGEVVSPAAAAAVLEACPNTRLLHVYGPTEATTFTLWHEVKPGDVHCEKLPLGNPLEGWSIALEDDSGGLIEGEGMGELLIGGVGLAQGYFQDLERTNRAFVIDHGERWYRTGDWVCRTSDGALEFVGRRDREVKIRGFRIQLDEIETAMNGVPGVNESVVWVHRDTTTKTVQAAVLVDSNSVSSDTIYRHLVKSVDAALVPSNIFVLESFPRLPSGKTDRKTLEALGMENEPASAILDATPEIRNERLESVVRIWEAVFERSGIVANDRFHDLGGDSLLSVGLILELERGFGMRFPVDVLLHQNTPAKLAHWIDEPKETGVRLVELNPNGQSTLLFFHGDYTHGGHYCRKLAQRMPDVRFIIIPNPEILDFPNDASVETFVDQMMPVIQSMVTRGSCSLVGLCNAGLLAMETAQRLENGGTEVSFVGVVSPPYLERAQLHVCRILEKLFPRLPQGTKAWVVFKLPRLPYRYTRKLYRWLRGKPQKIALNRRDNLYRFMVACYDRPKLQAPVNVWVDSGFQLNYGKRCYNRLLKTWENAESLHELPGDHLRIDPEILSGNLRTALAGANLS